MMRLRWFILLLITLCSCTDKKTSHFLKDNIVELVAPRVSATSTVIDSSVTLNAELRIENVQLFYTEDSTEPTKNSIQYKNPIEVSNAGIYKFKAFHSDWKSSETTELKLYKKGITPKVFNWYTLPSESYPGQGKTTLINHKKALRNFRDNQWVGFDSISYATAEFNKNIFIKTLTIGYLIDTKSWIFPPEEVILIINKKDTITTKILEVNGLQKTTLKDVKLPINKTIEIIEIKIKNSILPDWHPGKGKHAWLFMDEWIFNE